MESIAAAKPLCAGLALPPPRSSKQLVAASNPYALLAIAIEDRVDLCFRTWRFRGEPNPQRSPDIKEGKNYFFEIYGLLVHQINRLVSEHGGDPAEIFDSIAAIVISVCGVVENNRILRQVILWHFPGGPEVSWQPPGQISKIDYFDFAEVLAGIAEDIAGPSWTQQQRARFANTVFVVNDATAAAANEAQHLEGASDFIYVKVESGVNVGKVWTDRGQVYVDPTHPEAGHGYPLPHDRDVGEPGFLGTCKAHGHCTEGVASVNSLTARALTCAAFAAWRPHAVALQGQFSGQRLDNAVLAHVLAELPEPGARWPLAVDVLAHYFGQLVYSLIIGPMTPGKVVLAGRMATEAVLEATRENVVAFSQGYPRRDDLAPNRIRGYIVLSCGGREPEIHGALAIARGLVADREKRRKKPTGRDSRLHASLPFRDEFSGSNVPLFPSHKK